MKIIPDCPLQDRHSFHIQATARYVAQYDSVAELQAILRDANTFGLPIMPMGGGCNMLFADDYPGILLCSRIMDCERLASCETFPGEVVLRVGAGWDWDRLVAYTVEKGWGNLQNLSGIPGTVGASPVQNIGAYGVEAKDAIVAVEVLDRQTLETLVLPAAECRFGYRDSRFKHEWKDRYVVTHVRFRLSERPVFELSYGALREAVGPLQTSGISGGTSSEMGTREKNVSEAEAVRSDLQAIREAVLAIRGGKLPDPSQVGSAGSFFMNPRVPAALAAALLEKYPDMPHWPVAVTKLPESVAGPTAPEKAASGTPAAETPASEVKLSAAWLIDRAGWKGFRRGDAGVWPRQPLVLVNYGQATGGEILALCRDIVADVRKKFSVSLRPEAIILGKNCGNSNC